MRIVIVVGDVDIVDKPFYIPYVGRVSGFAPNVGLESVMGASSPCGKNREKSIHKLSTEKDDFPSNPDIGFLWGYCLHMGVWKSRISQRKLDFSTWTPTYPQIMGSYPQNPCLDINLIWR
jgi:hypothetical protein